MTLDNFELGVFLFAIGMTTLICTSALVIALSTALVRKAKMIFEGHGTK